MAMRNLVSRLLPTRARRGDFLAQYVIRQSRRGRPLASILDDPYVKNRSTPEERARLLENPELVRTLGEQTIEEMRRSLGGTRVPADRGASQSRSPSSPSR
jgi:hypothetical protein